MPFITSNLHSALHALQSGQLVALPTETVYGLGADACNKEAVRRVYEYKKRPHTHPLILHLPHFSMVSDWVKSIPPSAYQLAQHYMPGALTLLLPAKDKTQHITAGCDTIAIRIPSHPLVQRLLSDFGGGIVAPSANQFGHLSPTTAADVMAEFSHLPDLMILEGGECELGIESTIVGFSGNSPFIARSGLITSAMVQTVSAQSVVLPPPHLRVSGNLERHYAPRKTLRLCTQEEIIDIARKNDAIGVLSVRRLPHIANDRWCYAPDTEAAYARLLFRCLRHFEAHPDIHLILVEKPPLDWVGVWDRLSRAAKPAQENGTEN